MTNQFEGSIKDNYFFVTTDGIKDIVQICQQYNAKSLLDYGAGKTLLNIPGVTVTRYDPYLRNYNNFPTSKYDIVVCHNSLNHVDKDHLKLTVNEIYNLATYALVTNIQFPGKNKVRTSEYVEAFEQAKFTTKDHTRTPLNMFEKLINVDITPMSPNWTLEPAVLYFLLEKGTPCSSS
jgi:hypothetical protein